MALWRGGRPLEALSAFEQRAALRSRRTSARWCGWVRSCWTRAGPTRHSLISSTPRVAIPMLADAFVGIALVMVQRRRFDDAESALQRAEMIDPQNPRLAPARSRLEAARSARGSTAMTAAATAARLVLDGLLDASCVNVWLLHRRMRVARDPAARVDTGRCRRSRLVRRSRRGARDRVGAPIGPRDAVSPAGDHGRRRRALRHGRRRRPRPVSRPKRQRPRSTARRIRRTGCIEIEATARSRTSTAGSGTDVGGLRHGRRRRRLRQRRRYRPVRHQRRPERPAAQRRRRPLHRRDGDGRRRRAGLEHERRVLRRRRGRRPRPLRPALHQLERRRRAAVLQPDRRARLLQPAQLRRAALRHALSQQRRRHVHRRVGGAPGCMPRSATDSASSSPMSTATAGRTCSSPTTRCRINSGSIAARADSRTKRSCAARRWTRTGPRSRAWASTPRTWTTTAMKMCWS